MNEIFEQYIQTGIYRKSFFVKDVILKRINQVSSLIKDVEKFTIKYLQQEQEYIDKMLESSI